MVTKLTDPERIHLLTLLYEDYRSGEYYGRKDQYYGRTLKMIVKLGGDPSIAIASRGL